MPAKGEKKMEEEKEVEVRFKFTNLQLITYAAIAALALGIIVGITAAAANGSAPGPQRFTMFLEGLLYGVFFGGVLLAFSELIIARK